MHIVLFYLCLQWNLDEHTDVKPYGASHGIADARAIGISNIEPNKASFASTNGIADRCTKQGSYKVTHSPAFWLAHPGTQQKAVHP